MRGPILSTLALALALGPTLAGVDDASWKTALQNFEDDFKKKSVVFKHRALEALPTTDERTITFIIEQKKLLQDKNWWIRAAAAERLGRVQVPELRTKVLAYAKHKDKMVREGILCAVGQIKHRLDPPVIVEALQDKDWEVRRMACFAAGQQRIKEAVPKMISMIREVDSNGKVLQEGELNPRVHSVLLYNLEEIVGQYYHTDVQQWKQYWEANKEKTLPPPKRFDMGTFGGVSLDYNDTFARRGTGPLVIVLPELNYSTLYYLPYFNQWLFVKWLFINLPPIRSFPGLTFDADNDPYYPVDILVDAFEDMRKKRNVEKMAILAHGFTTWIAAKYAQKYPDRVLGLILLNPWGSNETYGKRLDELIRSDDPDEEFWAKVNRKQIRIANPQEGMQYEYISSSVRVRDQTDLEVSCLRGFWRDPEGTTVVVPEFDIRGDNTSRVPVLMYFENEANRLQTTDDLKRMQRYYVDNITVTCKKSARLPFMEESEIFEKALRMFVEKKLNPAWEKAEQVAREAAAKARN